MNEYTKDELNQMFGKTRWFLAGSTATVTYISGISFLDSFTKSIFIDPNAIFFKQYPAGLVIEFISQMGTKRTGIKTSSINYIVLEHKDNVMYQKDHSVIGRAIVGGLLIGSLGAIIGGMSGIGSKGKLGDYPDNILTISYGSKFIVFGVKNKDYKAIEEFFKMNYSNKYKSPSEILAKESFNTKDQDNKANKETKDTLSISNEIKKLKELLDSGVITSEEFSKAKSKLLQ